MALLALHIALGHLLRNLALYRIAQNMVITLPFHSGDNGDHLHKGGTPMPAKQTCSELWSIIANDINVFILCDIVPKLGS